jgi:AraC-like DNA-binding protein
MSEKTLEFTEDPEAPLNKVISILRTKLGISEEVSMDFIAAMRVAYQYGFSDGAYFADASKKNHSVSGTVVLDEDITVTSNYTFKHYSVETIDDSD